MVEIASLRPLSVGGLVGGGHGRVVEYTKATCRERERKRRERERERERERGRERDEG